MNDQKKKIYTLEDNVKYIAFSLKDIVKQLEELNINLALISDRKEKNEDKNELPF